MRIRVGMVDSCPGLVLGIATLINAQPDLTFTVDRRCVRDLLSGDREIDVAIIDPVLDEDYDPALQVALIRSRRIGVVVFTGGSLARLRNGTPQIHTVWKTDPLPKLLEQIRLAYQNRSASVAPWPSTVEPGVTAPRLSPRERDVLELYAMGETAIQVAQLLGIGQNTVLDHIKSIREKYAAVGRAAPHKIDLFRRAAEDGVISSSSLLRPHGSVGTT